MRRIDRGADGSYAAMDNYALLNDAQQNVVAVLRAFNADLLERVEYDAYGHARHRWQSDLDGDGDRINVRLPFVPPFVPLTGMVTE